LVIRTAKLDQAGRKLILTVRTADDWSLGKLDPQPQLRSPESRYLCLGFSAKGERGETAICLGGSAHRVGVLRTAADGSVKTKRPIRATVIRPTASKAVVSLVPGQAGLRPGHYRWRAFSQWTGAGCGAAAPKDRCHSEAPASGRSRFRLRRVQAVGCTSKGPDLVFHGSRHAKTVALTFDDGPSDYTEKVVTILRHKRATGTFFEIGNQVGGRTEIMRRILRSGFELADHSTYHRAYPGYPDISKTKRIIDRATGFTPCLFRPPNGTFNSGTVASAARAGMKTVIWDVDPQDWSTPGTGAIFSRIVGAARPGSIILMHDGGGPRGETLAALPRIIDNLRRRGYSFATVTSLLGDRMIFRPVG
jgi:peptidoglycan/xylan/chitin deacetylase (PgdA/CDA1 family)